MLKLSDFDSVPALLIIRVRLCGKGYGETWWLAARLCEMILPNIIKLM